MWRPTASKAERSNHSPLSASLTSAMDGRMDDVIMDDLTERYDKDASSSSSSSLAVPLDPSNNDEGTPLRLAAEFTSAALSTDIAETDLDASVVNDRAPSETSMGCGEMA
mmetsp:Transcript_22004/g.61264  ORF Transcript_22004/g.61264 Transcript_22004/m.61264 type:complete len:110 (+) Transcript_22004:1259-1588(+)